MLALKYPRYGINKMMTCPKTQAQLEKWMKMKSPKWILDDPNPHSRRLYRDYFHCGLNLFATCRRSLEEPLFGWYSPVKISFPPSKKGIVRAIDIPYHVVGKEWTRANFPCLEDAWRWSQMLSSDDVLFNFLFRPNEKRGGRPWTIGGKNFGKPFLGTGGFFLCLPSSFMCLESGKSHQRDGMSSAASPIWAVFYIIGWPMQNAKIFLWGGALLHLIASVCVCNYMGWTGMWGIVFNFANGVGVGLLAQLYGKWGRRIKWTLSKNISCFYFL